MQHPLLIVYLKWPQCRPDFLVMLCQSHHCREFTSHGSTILHCEDLHLRRHSLALPTRTRPSKPALPLTHDSNQTEAPVQPNTHADTSLKLLILKHRHTPSPSRTKTYALSHTHTDTNTHLLFLAHASGTFTPPHHVNVLRALLA